MYINHNPYSPQVVGAYELLCPLGNSEQSDNGYPKNSKVAN